LKELEGWGKDDASLFGIFCNFDTSNDEKLDLQEFKAMLQSVGEFMEPLESHTLFDRLDTGMPFSSSFSILQLC
jgi:hypothetical protein